MTNISNWPDQGVTLILKRYLHAIVESFRLLRNSEFNSLDANHSVVTSVNSLKVFFFFGHFRSLKKRKEN